MANVGCRSCKHLRKETESWELPQYFYYICRKRPSMENLKSFPFRSTTCTEHTPLDGPRVADWSR